MAIGAGLDASKMVMTIIPPALKFRPLLIVEEMAATGTGNTTATARKENGITQISQPPFAALVKDEW